MTLKLQHIKNFKEYNPEIRPYGDSVIHYRSEDGRDWYDVQDLFQTDTLKIEYNPDGTISRFSYDVSMLSPEGRSVIEVEDTSTLRQAFTEQLFWSQYVVVGDELATKPPSKYHVWQDAVWKISNKNQALWDEDILSEARAQAAFKVSELRAQCDKDILPLQDALDLDEATPEEVVRLKALKRFRIALNRWEHPEVIPHLE